MIVARFRFFAAAAGLASLAFLGAACGGGESSGGGAGGTAATGEPSLDQRVKLARCMREHGVDMPDPKPGQEQEAISLGGNGMTPEKLEAALEECRQTAGMPPPRELTQKEKDDMLAYARCMREHGVDMPDPEVGEGGRAGAVKAPRAGAAGEEFERADKACGSR